MFQYLSEAELEAVAREHPGDIVVKVDSSLDTERKLIDHIEGAVKAPYTNDGIVDVVERNDMSVVGIKKKCLWLLDKIDGVAGISPKRRSLIPFFITDSPLSDFRELHSRTIYPLMKVFGRRRSLDYIAALVKREESRVSWVDIFLYSFDGEKAVYFVKLVCLGKRAGFVGFHACVEADLNGNTILH